MVVGGGRSGSSSRGGCGVDSDGSGPGEGASSVSNARSSSRRLVEVGNSQAMVRADRSANLEEDVVLGMDSLLLSKKLLASLTEVVVGAVSALVANASNVLPAVVANSSVDNLRSGGSRGNQLWLLLHGHLNGRSRSGNGSGSRSGGFNLHSINNDLQHSELLSELQSLLEFDVGLNSDLVALVVEVTNASRAELRSESLDQTAELHETNSWCNATSRKGRSLVGMEKLATNGVFHV